MNVFVTSDHHFGSWKNYLSWVQVLSEDQENDAIKLWNSIVKNDDLVYYLGDFHDCNALDMANYRMKLNGDIILVKGNHDVLPDEMYKSFFKDVLDEAEIDGISLRHVPADDGKKQIYGHLHRGMSRDPFMVENGFCACASFHKLMPLELRHVIEQI